MLKDPPADHVIEAQARSLLNDQAGIERLLKTLRTAQHNYLDAVAQARLDGYREAVDNITKELEARGIDLNVKVPTS